MAAKLSRSACFRFPVCRMRRIVMTYSAIKNEPNMWLLIDTLLDMGKQVALPCVTSGGLVAAAYRRDMKLDKGAYGIPQPAMGSNDPPIKPDLVIVPGVVFDLQGCRIGFWRRLL